MTSVTVITNADRARWQRQAARELAAILDDHAGLQVIAWTVNPAAGGLSGRVNGLAPAANVRAVFAAWQQALALEEVVETVSGDGAVAWLRARTRRNGVRVMITAAVFPDDEHGETAVTS